nr:hypothetical protein BaRGS_022416 [Batillaria attramentaria]
MWDLESGQYVDAFEGHTDYIHKVALKNDGQECISASEDGTVRIWDARVSASEAMQCIEPHKHEILSGGSAPAMNKWQLNGTLHSSIPCSPTSVFSLAINKRSESSKVLCISGASPSVDLCINFGYKAFSLLFRVT